jgi:hypothetical protein
MHEQNPEYLRTPQTACIPDVRNWDRRAVDAGDDWTFSFDDHYNNIREVVLNQAVPEEVVIQFETSKNIYLYAWFVYRFFPVARQHALSVLEFSMRERLDSEIHQTSKYRRGKRGDLYLSSMLEYCRDNGILKDLGFEVARNRASARAREHHMIETIKRMSEAGIESVEWDEPEIEISAEDRDFGHVSTLATNLPKIRNAHAHGSPMLDSHSLGTLKTVSEIINQLWPDQNSE